MKELNIGVVTYPGESGSDQLVSLYLSSFFTEILRPLCESLVAITGDLEINNKAVRIMNVPFHESGSHSLFSRILKYVISQLRVFPRLVAIAKSCQMIIFFDLAELYTVLIFITRFFLRKKVIIVHCGLPSRSLEVAYKGKMLGLGLAVSYLVRLFERASFSLANGIAVESVSVVKLHGLERYGRKICICRSYYIDIGAFIIEREIEARHNLAGYIGRFVKDKGAINFAQAIGKIDNLEDIEFLMVGGFSSEISQVAATVGGSNSHRVRLVGHVSYEQIPKYLNELKLLVLPSYGEGLPATILEAMACGTPVLATPVGGIPDVIKDGETGFILEDNTPEGIARNIVRALRYPRLDEVIENARQLVERGYTLEPTVKRWQEAFDRWGDSK